MAEPMRDIHRYLVQAFMSRGIMAASQMKEIFRNACQRFKVDADVKDLPTYVNAINLHMRPMHLEILKGIDEVTALHYYCMVNTVESSITLLASDYTSAELDLFKRIIEEMVSGNGTISTIDALNLTERRLSKKDAEAMLTKMVREKWLNEREGIISLAVRSLLELEKYLLEQFSELLTKCHLCNRIVIQGQECVDCDTKLHHHCAARLLHTQPNPKCPLATCGAAWPLPMPQQRLGRLSQASSTQAEDGGGEPGPRPETRRITRRTNAND